MELTKHRSQLISQVPFVVAHVAGQSASSALSPQSFRPSQRALGGTQFPYQPAAFPSASTDPQRKTVVPHFPGAVLEVISVHELGPSIPQL